MSLWDESRGMESGQERITGMMRQEKAGMLAASGLAMAITGYSAWKLLGTGTLSWHVAQPEFHSMAAELIVVWLLLFLLFFYGKDSRVRLAGTAAAAAALAWLHMVFLPMAFAGLYVCYLTLIGGFVNRKVARLRQNVGICWDFTTGVAVTITVFCLLSLVGQGSILKLRLWVIGSGLAAAGRWLSGVVMAEAEPEAAMPANMEERRNVQQNDRWNDRPGCRQLSVRAALMLSAIFMLLFLQMGRMNGAVDFDSIWYGVRSDVMLDSGRGIYENLGTLGVVYTYPKGWETLTLPLAGLPSYSFPIAFNICAAGLVLLAAYETACVRMKRDAALWIPFLMAAVPGIMNMSGTAKADIMTLFCQVLMVQAILRYEKERRAGWLAMGLAAGGVSLTMKPTAVIFSTAIVGMGVVWILWNRYGDRKHGKGQRVSSPLFCRELLLLLPAAAALAGIWGRTMKLVGVPVTSVFYQLFQKIGFQVKYPFYAAGFPSAGNEMSWMEKLRFFGGRLYGVLLNPQGDDMAHVIIAWGTVIPVVVLLLWMMAKLCEAAHASTCSRRRAGFSCRAGFLSFLLPAVAFINLVSLYSLYQIDGNYYILFYFLVILAGCMALERSGEWGWKAGRLALVPAWMFAVVLCCLTNWAWALGTGGLHPVNKGYYNHIEAEREKRTAQGSGAIWDILASDPKKRVIALGEHPGVLTFPCSVQSYVDVSGYWGNPEVVSTAPDFLQYLQYAKTDYLYMEKEYVDTSVRIYQIVRTLVEEGWLSDVRDENGNLILTVRRETPEPDMAAQNLEVFDNRYLQHP